MTAQPRSPRLKVFGPWVAAVLVVLVGLGAWQASVRGWWQKQPANPPPSPTQQTPEPTAVTPRVGTVSTYPEELKKAVSPLVAALAADDEALIAASVQVRTGLMALVVPAEERDRHLALVLLLTRIAAATPASPDFDQLRSDLAARLSPLVP